MSGIAAVMHWDGSGIARSDVERMAKTLRTYGPDGQRIVIRNNAAVVFCKHELTPEDSCETQPLILADRFLILFDGRIDNRSELGAILGSSSSELSSTADSIIALRLFDKLGERAFERMVGVFAIIIMDLREGSLLCARDHMGLRGLHYHRSAGRFAVATAPEVLFALSWVPQILSKEDLADRLAGRWPNGYGESTYYKDIFRVRPGSTVKVCGEIFSTRQFWDPQNIADVRFKNDHDYVEAFKERLDEAVRASLRVCVPPCAMITGGLDSSSIAVVAADMLAADGTKLNTFTAVPEAEFKRTELPGRYFDETPFVRQIASVNQNIVPHFITQSRKPLAGEIAKLIRISMMTGGTLNSLWGIDLYKAARSEGHNVILGGDGGNLTMSYHGWGLFTELLLRGRWVRLISEIRSSGYRWRRHVRHMLIQPLIPPPFLRKYKKWRRGQNPPWHNFSFIRPEFAERTQVIPRAAREKEHFDNPPVRDARLGRIRDFRTYTETADWHSMVRAKFGLDIRIPAFDRRLLEFCIGIPLDQYLRGGCDRWLIRRAMKGRLPPMVLDQKKCGAQAADWYPRLTRERNHIAEEVRRLAKNPEVESILDMERLKKMLEAWPDSQPPEYSSEEAHLLAIPDALGEAYFIETLSGVNCSMLQSGNNL